MRRSQIWRFSEKKLHKAHHTLADFLLGECRVFIADRKSASVGWIPTSHDKIGSCREKIKRVLFSDALTDLVGVG